MRTLLLLALLGACERAPQPQRQQPQTRVERARHPAAVTREHIEIADRMLTALVYLDMDVSGLGDCTETARVLERWLSNNDELRGQMQRTLDETSVDPAAKTWLAVHYAEKHQHAASQLLQWADQCAQHPAFRQALARLPIVR
jgi:hypothetical protein